MVRSRRDDQISDLRRQKASQPSHALDLAHLVGHTSLWPWALVHLGRLTVTKEVVQIADLSWKTSTRRAMLWLLLALRMRAYPRWANLPAWPHSDHLGFCSSTSHGFGRMYLIFLVAILGANSSIVPVQFNCPPGNYPPPPASAKRVSGEGFRMFHVNNNLKESPAFP